MPAVSNDSDTGAVIVAAGRSQRMAGPDKLWVELTGPDGRERPLLAYAVAAFQRCDAINHIILVVAEDAVERARELAQREGFDKLCAVVAGGARRQDSVRAGLDALERCDWVAIHDGARPLVTPDLIERGLVEAQETGASCCALPVPDTVKEAGEGRTIIRTLDRTHLWLAQTPQVFRYDLLANAHATFEGDATDDAAMIEALGGQVTLYPGSRRNLKVTTQEDLELVRALLKETS